MLSRHAFVSSTGEMALRRTDSEAASIVRSVALPEGSAEQKDAAENAILTSRLREWRHRITAKHILKYAEKDSSALCPKSALSECGSSAELHAPHERVVGYGEIGRDRRCAHARPVAAR